MRRVRYLAALCLATACLASADHLPRKPWFGAGLAPLEPFQTGGTQAGRWSGPRHRRAAKGGSAEATGFKGGEILLALDGNRVGTMERFVQLLAAKSSGRTVVLSLLVNGKRESRPITLVERVGA